MKFGRQYIVTRCRWENVWLDKKLATLPLSMHDAMFTSKTDLTSQHWKNNFVYYSEFEIFFKVLHIPLISRHNS
uniref:Uncharacterized protein n=1 Tax=Rhizophora mucronata TaxID=61149 RepID=A0A2P2MY32_RHIMU